MILSFLNIVLSVGNWLLLSLGVPNILPKIQALINSEGFSTFVTTFHGWLSWVFYFVPKQLILVLIGATLVFWILRIFMALFRVITDLL